MKFNAILAGSASVFLSLACPGLVFAQHMKPGLWEITNKMGGNPQIEHSMAEMQKRMASMPPEQRKMMEEMMSKKGLSVGPASGGGMAVKMCMTQEMIDRREMPTHQRGDCKSTLSEKTSTGMKMAFTCTNPPSSGEGQISYTSNEAYTMKMNLHRSAPDGKMQDMTMDAAGKWLSSDCGDVKPLQLPKR